LSRLPTVGGDDNTWGDILNDFLNVEHNTDGTQKTLSITKGGTGATTAGGARTNLSVPADSSVVHNSGAETIAGVKTFSSAPIGPTPAAPTEIANKSYVDGVAGSGSTPDADATTKGKLKLAGDLGGTADLPTVPGLTGKIDKSTVTTKGDLLAATGSAAITRLGVGTDNQILTADSSQTTGLKWATPVGGSGSVATDTIWDAKGDLAVATGADTATKLAVGANNQVLTADSTQGTGLKWAAAGAGSGDWTVQSKTAAYTAATGELVLADATSAAFTVTLPTAVGNAGKRIAIKRVNANSEGNNVTVGTTSSQTIDGATSLKLRAQNDLLSVVSDGSNWRSTAFTTHFHRVTNVFAPEFNADNTDTATAGAQIQAALDSFPTSGTRIGGVVDVPCGDYYIERPLIIPHSVRMIGSNSQGGGTIIRAHSTFPSMTLNNGGTLTLPAATIPVTAMSANMPTSGGVITMLSSAGIQRVYYTGISGNSFTGCTGGTGTVSDGAVVGTFMLWLGHPTTATGGTFGNRIENLALDGSTSGASAQAIPGISGIYSSRINEDSGGASIRVRNFMHRGIMVEWTSQATGVKAQDYMFRGCTFGASSTSDANCVGFEQLGTGSTFRGLDDATFTSVTNAQIPGTAMRITGSTGVYGRILVECWKIAVSLEGSGATDSNSGLVIEGLHAYGAGAGNMTDVIKIASTHVGSFILLGIRKMSAAGTNLINHNDGTNTYTLTDNSIGLYSVGEENASGKRTIITDSPSMGSRFTNGVITRTKAGTPTDTDYTVAPSDGAIAVNTSAHKLGFRAGGSWYELDPAGSGGGSVATDTIWDTKGDLAVATSADAASKLAVGSNGQVLTADSSQTTGIKWGSPSATSLAVSTKTGAYTITGSDDVILADATTAAFSVTLPTAVGVTKLFTIKRINSNDNSVTIATTSSQTIDGSTTQVISVPNDSITVVSDGSNWRII
jgi:hypothetical protein